MTITSPQRACSSSVSRSTEINAAGSVTSRSSASRNSNKCSSATCRNITHNAATSLPLRRYATYFPSRRESTRRASFNAFRWALASLMSVDSSWASASTVFSPQASNSSSSETLGTRHRLADASHLLVKEIFEGSLVHANILTILRSYAKPPLVIFTLAFHIRPSELQRDGCAV